MTRKEPPPPAKDEPSRKRRPYLKPAFKHERVFETMALACGKIGNTSAGCMQAKKFS